MVNSYASHISEELDLQGSFNYCTPKHYLDAPHQSIEGKTYKPTTKLIEQHHSPHKYSPTNFKIFHQNVRGISHKIDELLISLSQINPQVLCFTEHHLRNEEISVINLDQCTLGAYYCRSNFKQGGVSIVILDNIIFDIIDLEQFNKEKDFEICAVKIRTRSTYLIVLCVYRSPTGNFPYFLTRTRISTN